MNNIPKKKYSLFTAVVMIVGIVIGSGIFFKTPEILKSTNGDVSLGILAFLISGFGIIFGGLTIANYARIDDTPGGLVSYCELCFGKKFGFLAGWFQMVIYFPAICAIIGWVCANYLLALFNRSNILTTQEFNPLIWPLAIFLIAFFFILNLLKSHGSAKIQQFTTVTKISSLFLLAIAGILFGNPEPVFIKSTTSIINNPGFISALIAVAFTTDGWMLAPSIAHEIKDSKKNLSIALVISPIIIIGIYLLYFYGISSSIGPDAILSGVDPISAIATSLFGNIGITIIYLLVLSSTLGALNGLTLAFIRVPYLLAIRESIPFSKNIAKISPKYDTPINATILCFILTIIYLFIHFLSLDGVAVYNLNIINGFEVDAIPVVLNYIFLVCLYMGVLLKPNKFKFTNIFQKYLYPTLAILGSLIILYGGITKPNFNVYLIICVVITLSGLLIYSKKNV
ncbi:MAG: APC family permease [Anaerorhabdus sp.]